MGVAEEEFHVSRDTHRISKNRGWDRGVEQYAPLADIAGSVRSIDYSKVQRNHRWWSLKTRLGSRPKFGRRYRRHNFGLGLDLEAKISVLVQRVLSRLTMLKWVLEVTRDSIFLSIVGSTIDKVVQETHNQNTGYTTDSGLTSLQKHSDISVAVQESETALWGGLAIRAENFETWYFRG